MTPGLRTLNAFLTLIALSLTALPGLCSDGYQVFDFESGTLENWTIVSGEAGVLPTSSETKRDWIDFKQQGDYFIGLHENPEYDKATIVLKSKSFVIDANLISLLVGGGNRIDNCYVALYDAETDKELFRETGRNLEAFDERLWDVSPYKGKEVYIKIVDSYQSNWGHINVDYIHEVTPEAEAVILRKRAEKEQAYKDWEASIDNPEERIVYTGHELDDLAFPMGGVGSGHISLCGDGAIRQWEFFGHTNDNCVVPNSFFAVRTTNGDETVIRALQKPAVGGFEGVDDIEFVGEWPVAYLDYIEDELPVRVSLEAFSSHIPMNTKDSAVPCAFFEFTITNTSREEIEVTLLSNMQNCAGYDGRGAVLDVYSPQYGGNENFAMELSGGAQVFMSNPTLAEDDKNFGSVSQAMLDRSAVVGKQWDSLTALYMDFEDDGKLGKLALSEGPSPRRQTWNSAVYVTKTLRPRQSVTIPVIWAWHFPNNYNWWDQAAQEARLGRMYNNWFDDAGSVTEWAAENYERLKYDTVMFKDTFYETTLPYYMRDRILAQSSTLASTVTYLYEDGSFAGFEGAGCCPMNCAHVYNYEMMIAHLYPDLERNIRRIDLEVQQRDDGAVHHRTRFPLSIERWSGPFCDGQLGLLCKCYREYRQSVDAKWLDKMWPRIKKAMDFVLSEYDPNHDGVIVGSQWNTYDATMYGPNTFIGSMYLCALAATTEMAKVQGEDEYANMLAVIRKSGEKKLDSVCWNGEYYEQIHVKPLEGSENAWLREDWPDEVEEGHPNRPYGKGCHIDQLLGQWWAYILDLGEFFPEDRIGTTIDSIMEYNWVKDFGEVKQTPRPFAGENDPGVYTCTWPYGEKPEPETLYSFEVWTGLEYELAGLMIYNDRFDDAKKVVKAVSDRYDGVRRYPITRNPWAEVECGNHYARAMSAWSILLAAQGYDYRGPDNYLSFAPRISPDDHKSFFTSAQGWGLFTQERNGKSQHNMLDLRYGALDLDTFVLDLAAMANEVLVELDGREVAVDWSEDDGSLVIEFADTLSLERGSVLEVWVK